MNNCSAELLHTYWRFDYRLAGACVQSTNLRAIEYKTLAVNHEQYWVSPTHWVNLRIRFVQSYHVENSCSSSLVWAGFTRTRLSQFSTPPWSSIDKMLVPSETFIVAFFRKLTCQLHPMLHQFSILRRWIELTYICRHPSIFKAEDLYTLFNILFRQNKPPSSDFRGPEPAGPNGRQISHFFLTLLTILFTGHFEISVARIFRPL